MIRPSADDRPTVVMTHTVIPVSKFIFFIYSIVVYGLKIIGIAPFSFRRSVVRSDQTQPFAHSKIGAVYNLLLIIPISVGAMKYLVTIVGLASNKTSVSNSINNAVYILRRLVSVVSACLILIVWSLRQKKAAAALNLLQKISAQLSALKQQPANKWVTITFMIHFTINAVLWITVAIRTVDYGSLRGFVISFFRYFPTIINFWFCLEYSMLVGFIARKFQAFNYCLANYRALNYSSPARVRINTCITNRGDCPASIRLLRGLRLSLIELCDEIADFFSLPILFCILHSFCAFVVDIYNIFIFAHDPNKFYSKLKSQSTVVWSLLIIGVFGYPVVLLALKITRAKQEAGLTVRIVNKLSFATMDHSEIQVELKHFSRELQTDNADVFTAYGFFSLDSTLLPSMLASAATYFVVFLQLRSPDCGPEHPGNYTVPP